MDRSPNGEYFLTAYGKAVLEILPSLRFITENRDFFLDHEIGLLPQQFVRRLGDLEGSKRERNVSGILRHTEQVIAKAKEFVWLMSDQVFLSTQMSQRMFSNRTEIAWKILIPRSALEGAADQSLSFPENFDLRFLDDLKAGIAMNERRAGVTFADLKGKLDMSSGFGSDDRGIRSWCKDLFLYYWQTAGKEMRAVGEFQY